MNIQIRRIVQRDALPLYVEFTTELGTVWGAWVNGHPEIGAQYDVECAVNDNLVWGDNINMIPDTEDKITMSGEHVIIRGHLENYEDDGFSCVRLGKALLMLETEGQAPPIGSSVQLRVQSLTLYDTNP